MNALLIIGLIKEQLLTYHVTYESKRRIFKKIHQDKKKENKVKIEKFTKIRKSTERHHNLFG